MTYYYLEISEYKKCEFWKKKKIDDNEKNNVIESFKNKMIYIVDDENKKCIYNNNEFRRKYKNLRNKGQWHQRWQSYFPKENNEQCIGKHRTDVLINNICIEFQNCKDIDINEVNDRTKEYTNNYKKTIWILNFNNKKFGKNTLQVCDENKIKITNKTKQHFISQFNDVPHCFIHFDKKLIHVKIDTRNHTCYEVSGYLEKKEFIKIINSNKFKIDELNFKPLQKTYFGKIYINQRGAGSGKTWESVQLLDLNNSLIQNYPEYKRYENKKNFIYLTKIHPARVNIFNEFNKQMENNEFKNIKNVKYIKRTKYDKITCFNKKYEKEIIIIIATIDSFIYNLGKSDCDKMNINFFKDIISKTDVPKHAYRGINVTDSLVIIDEAQDLASHYGDFLNKILMTYNCDFHLIGDLLQSIWHEENIYSDAKKIYDKENNDISHIEYNDGANICRRFINEENKEFVNKMIPFDRFGLKNISKIGKNNDKIIRVKPKIISMKGEYVAKTEIVGVNGELERIPNIANINMDCNKIIDELKLLLATEIILPNEFLFIFTVIKNNNFAVHLEMVLEEFWISTFSDLKYIKKLEKKYNNVRNNMNTHTETLKYLIDNKNDMSFCQLHKSEDGRPIDLNESVYKTRLMSIHSTKGLTCKYVFVVNMSNRNLFKFSKGEKNIIYYSLMHVAFTRQTDLLFLCDKEHFYEEDAHKSNSLQIKKWNKLNDIISDITNDSELCDEINVNIFSKNETYRKNIKKINKKSNNELIDYNEHMIRYNCMTYKIIADLLTMNNSQIFAKHCNLKFLVKVCYYKEYKDKTNLIDQYNKNWKNKEEQNEISKSMVCPILCQKNGVEECSNIIKYIFKHIQNKIFNNGKFISKCACNIKCPLEIIILNHFYLFMNKPYENMTVKDVIKIVSYWKDTFVLSDNHKKYNCLCEKIFYAEKNSKNKHIDFFEDLSMVCKHIEKIIIDRKNVDIKNDKPFFAPSQYINFYDLYFVDIVNNTTKEHTIIEPVQSLTKLNGEQKYLECLFKIAYLNILNQNENNKFILFSLNLENPITISFTNEQINCANEILKKAIIKKIKTQNKIFVTDLFGYIDQMKPCLDDKFEKECDENDIDEKYKKNVKVKQLYNYLYSDDKFKKLSYYCDGERAYPEMYSKKVNCDLLTKPKTAKIVSKTTINDYILSYLDNYVSENFSLDEFQKDNK